MKNIQNKKIHPSKISRHAEVRKESTSLTNTKVEDLFNQDEDGGSEEPILKSKKGDADAEVKVNK